MKHLHKIPEGLFAILDPSYFGELSTAQVIEAFLDGEAVPFIARAKSLSPTDTKKWVHEIAELSELMDFDFIVHHHVDMAQKTDALGVHLTAQSLSVRETRQILGPEKIIGYSAHSVDEALRAIADGADTIFLGAIFPTPKENSNHPILGLNPLADLCQKTENPIYAIGGIDARQIPLVKSTGAHGFVALRAIYENGDVEHNISKLGYAWEDS